MPSSTLSPARESNVRRLLERNELGIRIADDLNNHERLNARCKVLLESGKRSEAYIVGTLQAILKQLSKWAFMTGRILPCDPLNGWADITKYKKTKKAAAEELRPAVGAETPYHELNRELNENQTVRTGKSTHQKVSQVDTSQEVILVGASGFNLLLRCPSTSVA